MIGSQVQSAKESSGEPPSYSTTSFEWTDRHSPYDKTNARAIAEDELLSMHNETFVLNLSGLWVSSNPVLDSAIGTLLTFANAIGRRKRPFKLDLSNR